MYVLLLLVGLEGIIITLMSQIAGIGLILGAVTLIMFYVMVLQGNGRMAGSSAVQGPQLKGRL